jgi:8-amino-7-oxononanoate synthase
MLSQQIQSYLADLRQTALYRKRVLVAVGDNELNFSSSDYLSLISESRIKQAYQKGYEHYPSGSGSSMVVCGYHPIHQALEQAFCEALNVDKGVLFSSGYAANLSILHLLAQLDAHAVIDKAIHASIYDGLKLAGITSTRYLHNDLNDLALKLDAAPEKTVLLTESIHSMSGQIAKLDKIAHLAQNAQHELIVDEAHAFGVMGQEGLGGVVNAGLTQQDVPLRMIPFGKAMSASGAIIVGQAAWVEALIQAARPHTYSTALSPAFAYGLLETFDIVRKAEDRRAKLSELIIYFHAMTQHSPLKWRYSSSPIQQLQLGCPKLALSYAAYLREHGIICFPMRRPTVSKIDTGLRIILNYDHQPENIDHLFKCLHAY